MTPTLTAATRRFTGDVAIFFSRASHANASTTATHAPVIDAVRVPPSACNTSQSTLIVNSPNLKSSSIARRLRPMRRWISCVRPPIWVRSRDVRVCVARGSIAYSAVIHPSPLPRFHPGTPSSTLAVHSTRVFPHVIRHDPSAYCAALRLISSGRSASSARPTRAESSGAGTKRLNDASGGMTCSERYDVHASAPRFDLGATDDGIGSVIAALHQHIWSNGQHELERRVFIECGDRVDALERGEHVRTLGLSAHGARGTLEATNRLIGVDADDQAVAERACGHEQVDVAGVQQIEHAVGKHHEPRLRLTPANRVAPGHHLPRRGANAQKTLSTCGLKSISCCFHGRSTISMYSHQI